MNQYKNMVSIKDYKGTYGAAIGDIYGTITGAAHYLQKWTKSYSWAGYGGRQIFSTIS